MTNKKLAVGWFSFTCCEDSLIVFTELLNEHYFRWKQFIEFRHFRILKAKNKLENLDIAFVEGAVSSKQQRLEVEKIRKNCKKLVAVGACACTGKPSDARNHLPPEKLKKHKDVFKRFKYAEKVLPLEQVVQVDDKLPGCPMNGDHFVEKLSNYADEFNIDRKHTN